MTLWTLWYASLALALLSVCVMLVLIGRRVLDKRRKRARDALRAATSAALLDYLGGSTDCDGVMAAAGGRPELIADLAFQMRELVRGGDTARLVELAIATGGFARATKRLRRRNPQHRLDAVRYLGMYGEHAAPLLENCLADGSEAIRLAAAVELTRMGRAPHLQVLAAALNVGDATRSEELRQVFRPAVAGDLHAAVAILDERGTRDALRMLLIDGLAQAGILDAVDAIAAVTRRSPSPAIRAEAVRALATLGHPAAASAVVEGLSDTNWWVRAQAATAVRRIGIQDAVVPLADLLGDEQWWVRLRAAEALCALGEAGETKLHDAASGSDHAARVAQLVLAERGIA